MTLQQRIVRAFANGGLRATSDPEEAAAVALAALGLDDLDAAAERAARAFESDFDGYERTTRIDALADAGRALEAALTAPVTPTVTGDARAAVHPSTDNRCADNAAELRQIGDALQSTASRLSEHVLARHHSGDVNTGAPYEVHLAALEAEDWVARWTEARRQHRG